MDSTKAWYQSTSIQGSVIATVGFILNLLSTHYHFNITTVDVTFYVSSIFSVIGLVMAIYGRAVATTKLTS